MKSKINIDLIIEGCHDQKRGSQRRLYEHFYGYAMSIVLRYARDYEDAREVLNDSFLKVFNHIDKYDKDRPFKAWLRRILVNTSIDHQRKRKVIFINEELNDDVLMDHSIEITIDDNQDILVVLQRLSPQYRMVFNLYVFEGYKHDEIAEKLGISAGTSRSNLLRAKNKLKLWLSDYSSKKKVK